MGHALGVNQKHELLLMGYFFLFLSLLSSLTIAIMLKFFEKWEYNRIVVIASNYAVACLLGIVLSKPSMMENSVIPFAVIVGLLFFVTFVIYSVAIRKEGIAPAVTFGRISLAIPVLLSILLWGERPRISNFLGLVIIFTVVLSWEGRVRKLSATLLTLFLLSGTIDASMKYFKVHFSSVNEGKFLLFIFLSAFLWSWTYILIVRKPLKVSHIIAGLTMGIPNFFSSFFLLKALEQVPAYVFFPFITIGLITLSALAGYIFFSENLPRRKVILILLGILGALALTF